MLSTIRILLIAVFSTVFSITVLAAGAQFGQPVPGNVIVEQDGLEWVWASPCAGACSNPLPGNAPGGWRYATDDELSNHFPPQEAFFFDTGLAKCASPQFDPTYNHCDGYDFLNGYYVSQPNTTNYESFFVRNVLAPDTDGDGVSDNIDNCPVVPNSDQFNDDGDISGNACDVCPYDPLNDADGDGTCGNIDNCPLVSNPAQLDADADGIGDLCDPDDDNDSVPDGADNCPFDANADQSDLDGDGAGDACDADVDGDNVWDDTDACPASPANAVVNSEGCAIAEICSCENDWKNHGSYVSCVAQTADEFASLGLISETEKGSIVSLAAQSSCGAKIK